MSLVRTVAKNTLAQGFSKGVSIFCSILLTILLTRSLGKNGFGDYTFITSLVLLFGTVADWGTNIVTVREASANLKKSTQVFSVAIVGRLILAFVAFVLFNVFIRLNSEWSTLLVPATIGSFVLLALSLKTSVSMVFHSFQRLELASFVDLFASVLFVIFVFLLAQGQATVDTIMLVWAFATLLSAVLGIAACSRLFNFQNIFDKEIINLNSVLSFFKSRFLREALPAGFLFVLSTVYNRVDILILQHFKGSEAVASYGLPYKVYDQVILVSAFLMASLFPVLSKAFTENHLGGKLREYYQRAFDVLLMGGGILAFGLFLVSPLLINFLGDSSYPESVEVLRILSFAVLPSFFNHLTGYSLLAFGKQRISLLIAIFALLLNVSLNLLLVPKFSYQGSAAITFFTELFVFLLSTVAIARVLKFTPSLLSFPTTFLKINRIYSRKNV